MQLLPGQVPALQRPRPEVLQQEIGLGDQFLEDVLTLFLPQIQRDRLLVAGNYRPPKRHAVGFLLAPVAHRVGPVRRLHLDHLGAEIRHQLSAERARQKRAEFNQPQIGQRAGLVRHVLESPYRAKSPALLVSGPGP